jgi:hypothetical protein
MANPFDEGKQETTRVCHFRGDAIVWGVLLTNGFEKLGYCISYLVRRCGAGEIENLYVSFRRPNYHQRVGYIETITAFRESDRGYGVLTPDIPILSFQMSVHLYQATT